MSTFNERTLAEAQALVARVMPVQNARDAVAHTIANPVCGKPGRGFKAARKLRSELVRLDNELTALDTDVRAWITQNRKASMATRAKRLAILNTALHEYTAQLGNASSLVEFSLPA